MQMTGTGFAYHTDRQKDKCPSFCQSSRVTALPKDTPPRWMDKADTIPGRRKASSQGRVREQPGKVSKRDKPTTDTQSRQTFFLKLSWVLRGSASAELWHTGWEELERWVRGLSRVLLQPCTVHEEKTVGHFRHLTLTACFRRLGSASPTSNTLLALPSSQGHSWLQLLGCRRGTLTKNQQTTWEGALPVAWLCWEHLSFPMQLDVPIVSQLRGMLLDQAAAVLQGTKISAGVKPAGKAAREQRETETSTKLPLPLTPHLTHQFASPLYQTSCREEHLSLSVEVLFGTRSCFGSWLLLLSTAGFWGTGPTTTPNNLICRLQHCFPKADPFCSLPAFSCRVFLHSQVLVQYQALPSWRNFCHEYFGCILSFTVTLWPPALVCDTGSKTPQMSFIFIPIKNMCSSKTRPWCLLLQTTLASVLHQNPCHWISLLEPLLNLILAKSNSHRIVLFNKH